MFVEFFCADVEVQAGTELVIGARLEDGYDQNTGSPGILEESKELRGKSEICIARSLVVPRAGQTPVRIANFSDRPFKISADLPIAEYHPIRGMNSCIIPIEVDLDLPSTSHSSCSAIDRTVRTGEQAKKEGENWKLGAQENLEGLSGDQRDQFASLMNEYDDIFAVNSLDLGKSDLMEHEIKTGDSTPIKQPHVVYHPIRERLLIINWMNSCLLAELNSLRALGVAQLYWLGNMMEPTVCVSTFEDSTSALKKTPCRYLGRMMS